MATAFASIAFFAVFVLTGQIEIAMPILIIVFLLVMGLPKLELRKKISIMESELPFFLRNFGMLISMGIPYSRAIEISSKGSVLEEEFSSRFRTVGDGSVQKVLSDMAISFDSLIIKRAISQMMTLYEIGGSGKEIRKVGEDILAIERHKLKQYAAKSSIFGLMFVMTSAVLPTFFIVYAIGGAIGLGTKISNMEMAIALMIVFPAISALLLLVAKASMPSSTFGSRWFNPVLLLPAAMIVLGMLMTEFQIVFLLIGIGMGGHLAIKNFQKEQKIEQIEEKLGDGLFTISTMPKSVDSGFIFETWAKSNLGELSNEAASAKRQLKMNIGTISIMENLVKRNRSKMLEHALRMIMQMIETNSLNHIGDLAEDIIKHLEIKRERSQLLATQKYTLILGVVLIPAILKTTLNLIGTMGEVLGNGATADVLANCNSLVPAYIVVYATMVSIAIADSEGRSSSASIYMVILSIAGLIAFQFINI